MEYSRKLIYDSKKPYQIVKSEKYKTFCLQPSNFNLALKMGRLSPAWQLVRSPDSIIVVLF